MYNPPRKKIFDSLKCLNLWVEFYSVKWKANTGEGTNLHQQTAELQLTLDCAKVKDAVSSNDLSDIPGRSTVSVSFIYFV